MRGGHWRWVTVLLRQCATTFVNGRLTAAMVGTGPQPATHYPCPFPSIEHYPAAARNSFYFKVSAPALAR